MFEVQYNELWMATDLIAERIRSLGAYAPYGYAQLGKLSSFETPAEVPPALDMVRTLVRGHEAVAKQVRATFGAAEEANDQVTVDLLTQRLQVHEKNAWMLRSLLEDGGAA